MMQPHEFLFRQYLLALPSAVSNLIYAGAGGLSYLLDDEVAGALHILVTDPDIAYRLRGYKGVLNRACQVVFGKSKPVVISLIYPDDQVPSQAARVECEEFGDEMIYHLQW
ncbi:MAG: hypothetical protein KME35_15240 [Aphanocapsa sp. GSE-SYN-MK-11-07L]|jgi:hypothetical protein|nr:hypothetical protein [Aphanocapsa sp. GSE-SYN-MK-11-07L]